MLNILKKLLGLMLCYQAASPLVITPDAAVMKLDEIGIYTVGYAYRGQAEKQFPIGWSGFFEERTGVACQPAGEQNGKKAFLLHCPWRGGAGVAFQEFVFCLPSARRVRLRGATAMRADIVDKSDGVTFRVYANGRKLLDVHRADANWQPFEFDLTEHAGKTLTVRFETDPGPKDNPGFDFSLWGERELILEGYSITVMRAANAAPAPKSAAYAGIGQKHWVKSKTDGGGIIQLEDGSLWEISPIDKVNTLLWLPLDEVVVVESKNPLYPYKLIRERDTAEAKIMTPFRSAAAIGGRGIDVELFDSTGSAVAYISAENDMTIYLWSGTPCAYLDDENIYGFNGKHLGWFLDGFVYDHAGRVVAAIAENFRGSVKAAPVKGLKKLRPLKALKELKPLKPLFVKAWSETPATAFFLRGAK